MDDAGREGSPLCARVCACVRACVRACVCEWGPWGLDIRLVSVSPGLAFYHRLTFSNRRRRRRRATAAPRLTSPAASGPGPVEPGGRCQCTLFGPEPRAPGPRARLQRGALRSPWYARGRPLPASGRSLGAVWAGGARPRHGLLGRPPPGPGLGGGSGEGASLVCALGKPLRESATRRASAAGLPGPLRARAADARLRPVPRACDGAVGSRSGGGGGGGGWGRGGAPRKRPRVRAVEP